MRYYLIAGEASGDLHGSNLIRGLRAEDPRAEFRFWGGALMLAAAHGAGVEVTGTDGDVATSGGGDLRGCAAHGAGVGGPRSGGVGGADSPEVTTPGGSAPGPLVRDYREGAVMGFGDIISKAGRLIGNLTACKKDISHWHPDVVILIDYPGFNMRIARYCHKHGIKVFYYIAPKTWASRENRNRKLKNRIDKLFIVFPFEIPYFTEKGIPFIYKGNPLIDAIDAPDPTPSPQGRYIAILAGSRKGEISRMMPVCMKAADALHATPGWEDTRFIIAGAPSRDKEDYDTGGRPYVTVLFDRTYAILRGAQAAIINSGTASLEAALIGTPQVVGWSTGRFTAFLARKVLHVLDHIKYISLGNLIIDRPAFRELIQEDLTAENITEEIKRLVTDEAYRTRMQADYADIRQALGGSGASRAVAAAMIAEIGKDR